MVFNQLASWLFSTSKTDTRARFHRVEKAAGTFLRIRSNVRLDSDLPSKMFVWPIWMSRRARVASSPRLYDATNSLDSPFAFVAQKVWNSNSTRRASSPKQGRDDERSTVAKKMPALNDDRLCAFFANDDERERGALRIVVVRVAFEFFVGTIPLSPSSSKRRRFGYP